MELNVSRQPVFLQEMVCNTTVEQPVEGDMLLPDYCPDLVRLLRCVAQPAVEQASVDGDRLTVDGTVLVHIYYKGEHRQLCHAEYRLPFHKTVELRSAPQSPMVQVWPVNASCNCRVVSQRRLDVRGAVTLRCQVTNQRKEELVTGAEGMGVQCREEMFDSCRLLAREDRYFQVKEDLTLPTGLPPVAEVLRVDIRLSPLDCKVIDRKIIAKGEACIALLYRPEGEENQRQTTRLTLPISQIFEVEGLTEACTCTVGLQCCSWELLPQNDLDGEARTLGATLNLVARITAVCPVQGMAVSDCFSTNYPCEAQMRPFTAQMPAPAIKEEISLRQHLDLPAGVETVDDLWCVPNHWEGRWEKDSYLLTGELTLFLLGVDSEGSLDWYDQVLPFEHTLPMAAMGDTMDCSLCCQLTNCDFTASAVGIDLQAAVLLSGLPLWSTTRQGVTDLTVDGDAPLQRDNRSALTVYYASPGESVWEIAKRYHTSPQWILEENGLADDSREERRMLLIPVV